MIDSTPEIRFQRLLARNRPGDVKRIEEFKRVEERDLGYNQESHGQQHAQVFKLAHIKIENYGTEEELKLKVDSFL